VSTNTAHNDYLRLATFNYKAFLDIVAKLRRRHRGWRPSHWLQYSGQKTTTGIFYGAGEQNGRGHAVVHVSGTEAHNFLAWWSNLHPDLTADFYCTRFDLQVTARPPAEFDYLLAHQKTKNTTLYLSPSGNTLYIGSRESDSFWRIYDKEEGKMRVEVELKGKQAKRAYVTFMRRNELGSIYNTYLKRSRVPKILADHYLVGDYATIKLEKADEDEDLGKKLAWLATLDSLVYKLANDHTMGERTHALMSRWAEYGQNIDS
jgi:hypothetical protein